MISDGADYTRNTPRVEYPYIQSVYELYDAEHKVENVHFPSESHDYGYLKRSAAYNFLAHHMKLNHYGRPYKDGYREDFIRILPDGPRHVVQGVIMPVVVVIVVATAKGSTEGIVTRHVEL